MPTGTKGEKRPRDPSQLAKLIVAAFGADLDYAPLVKLYGASSDGTKGRYSPAECCGAIKTTIEGKPDQKHISTSYAERANLTMRIHMRRFTRLTNGTTISSASIPRCG
jgi:hypothetical protein